MSNLQVGIAERLAGAGSRVQPEACCHLRAVTTACGHIFAAFLGGTPLTYRTLHHKSTVLVPSEGTLWFSMQNPSGYMSVQVRIQNRIAMQQRASRAASNDEDSEGTLEAEQGGALKREADNGSAPVGPPPIRRKLNRAIWDTMEHRFDDMQLSLWEGKLAVRLGHMYLNMSVVELCLCGAVG